MQFAVASSPNERLIVRSNPTTFPLFSVGLLLLDCAVDHECERQASHPSLRISQGLFVENLAHSIYTTFGVVVLDLSANTKAVEFN